MGTVSGKEWEEKRGEHSRDFECLHQVQIAIPVSSQSFFKLMHVMYQKLEV